MSLEEDVRELKSKQAVVDLLHKLCYLLDGFQLDRLVEEIYAPDASDDHGGGPVKGREAIRAWYEDSTRNISAMAHNLANLVVSIDGNTATARSNVIAWAWTMENEGEGPMRPADYALSVSYYDRLSNYPEGWRLDERVLVSNSTKTDEPKVIAVGELPPTQRGIQSLSRRAPYRPE